MRVAAEGVEVVARELLHLLRGRGDVEAHLVGVGVGVRVWVWVWGRVWGRVWV